VLSYNTIIEFNKPKMSSQNNQNNKPDVNQNDFMSGVMSLGAFLSGRSVYGRVPKQAWDYLDLFLASVPGESISGIAQEMVKSHVKISDVYKSYDKLRKGNLSVSEKSECNKFAYYSMYVSSKVTKIVNPTDMLSAYASMHALDQYTVMYGQHEPVSIFKGKTVEIEMPAVDSMRDGFNAIKTVENNICETQNPKLTKHIINLVPDCAIDSVNTGLASGELQIGGVAISSIVKAATNARTFGNDNGDVKTIELTPSEIVDITVSQSDMVYLCQSDGETAKRKIPIVESGKLVDVGLDVYDMGMTNEINKQIILDEFKYDVSKKSDEEMYSAFRSFVLGTDESFDGPFNFSWISSLSKDLVKNHHNKVERKNVILYNAAYYYVTSGYVSWYIVIDLGSVVKNAEKFTLRWNDTMLQCGPNMVRKIFSWWNFIRFFSNPKRITFGDTIAEYAKKFLVRHKLGLSGSLPKFVVMAFSRMCGKYAVSVTTRDTWKIKKKNKKIEELGLGVAGDEDSLYVEGVTVDPFAAYRNKITIEKTDDRIADRDDDDDVYDQEDDRTDFDSDNQNRSDSGGGGLIVTLEGRLMGMIEFAQCSTDDKIEFCTIFKNALNDAATNNYVFSDFLYAFEDKWLFIIERLDVLTICNSLTGFFDDLVNGWRSAVN
jgi:hypothetical protein